LAKTQQVVEGIESDVGVLHVKVERLRAHGGLEDTGNISDQFTESEQPCGTTFSRSHSLDSFTSVPKAQGPVGPRARREKPMPRVPEEDCG
jgi:hypothetical protein